MASINRELVILIMQFLDEEKFKETVHKLEQESGFFFNMKYFEEGVLNGNWDEVEKYLSGFTKVDDNRYSMKIFFELRKQKYLEALDKHDRPKAIDILVKDLKMFASFDEELFKEITQLLTLDNFRENEQLSKYGDMRTARAIMLVELKKLIEENPLFRDKLQFPNLRSSRLRTLINQSLNWQHQLCNNRRPNPDIKTLFVDHYCAQSNGVHAPASTSCPLPVSLPKAGGFPPLSVHMPPQLAPASVPASVAGWMSISPASTHHVVSSGGIGLTASTNPGAIMEHRRTPPTTNLAIEYPSVDSDSTSRKTRPIGISDVATSSGIMDRASPAVPPPGKNGDAKNSVDLNPRIVEELVDKDKSWKLTEIDEPARCQSLRLMDYMKTSKICRLIYTNSGLAILALTSNAIHLLWKWPRNNSNGKAVASVSPQLWQPPSDLVMTNDTENINPEEEISCFALSKNDSYVMSASGGKISLFSMVTFKTITTIMPPPPAATFLAFHPQDNNIVAIGMADSTIQIYSIRFDEVRNTLVGHSKRITGLAFSNSLKVLVSAGADAQLFVWGFDGWEKKRNQFLQIPSGRASTAVSDTLVQFHKDQIHFLVAHETQIALYEAKNLECVKQWVPCDGSASISQATFSCDGEVIYVTFLDAALCIFSTASFTLMCRINRGAYLHANVSSGVYPTVIAAHPSQPNQFALGLTDGSVHVLEPLESEGKWGVAPPA